MRQEGNEAADGATEQAADSRRLGKTQESGQEGGDVFTNTLG